MMATKTISSGIVIVVLFALMVFLILPTLQQPNFSLELSESKVKRGSDVTLFITMTNNSNDQVDNVNFLIDSNSKLNIGQSKPTNIHVGTVLPKESKRYSTTVGTGSVQQGVYSIEIEMYYELGSENSWKSAKIVYLEIFE